MVPERPESRRSGVTTSACICRLSLLATPAPESLRMSADLRVASCQVNRVWCPQDARIQAAQQYVQAAGIWVTDGSNVEAPQSSVVRKKPPRSVSVQCAFSPVRGCWMEKNSETKWSSRRCFCHCASCVPGACCGRWACS